MVKICMKITKSAFMGQNCVGVGKPSFQVVGETLYIPCISYIEREERLKENCYKRWKSIYNC